MARKQFLDSDTVGVLDSPEEVLSTLTKEGKRKWVYPVPSHGRYWRARKALGWFLIVLFLGLPIVRLNGRPALLLDFVHREFAILGTVFYPTDTLLLMLFMIGSLLSIFLFTALLGRVWCGWGCPQTVYLEFVFRPIERLIEGKEHVRKRRDAGPWTWDKLWRKSVKLGIFAAISLFLAHTFVAYFVGWDALLRWMQRSPTEHWGFFVMMGMTTGLVLYNFAYFREQLCTIACPYARIQSVLLDPDSLIVSYDPGRGEPRGKRKLQHADSGVALGDCIDCGACVRTCPTGIDIRDGLQMECIACTQCIDACDEIMDRIEKPRGLIRYTSERELMGLKTRRIRPRTVFYMAALLLMSSGFMLVLSQRGGYEVNVGRSVGGPFTELPDGRIANRLRFRVRNQGDEAFTFTVEATAPAGAEVKLVGPSPVAVGPQQLKRIEAFVVAPSATFHSGAQQGHFVLRFSNGETYETDFPLLGPSK